MNKLPVAVLPLLFAFTHLSPMARAEDGDAQWLNKKCAAAQDEPSCIALSNTPRPGWTWQKHECAWEAGRCGVHQERLDMANKNFEFRSYTAIAQVLVVVLGVFGLIEPRERAPYFIVGAVCSLASGLYFVGTTTNLDADYTKLSPKTKASA